MAHINRIERMPKDALREILSRVAGQQDGAADIARAFAVSKTFRDFVEDGDVLRAVSFKKNSFKSFSLGRCCELLSEADGLVARCSRAGNLNARLILSKVVILSALLVHDEYWPIDLNDLDKAAYFLDRFSAQNTNRAELFGIVRIFLSGAKVRDLIWMRCYLNQFIALYLPPEKKSQFPQFRDTLEMLCMKIATPLVLKLPTSNENTLVKQFNAVHNMLKRIGLDERELRPLLECSVQMGDDAECESKIKYLDIVRPILEAGRDLAHAHGYYQGARLVTTAFTSAALLRDDIMELKGHEAVLQSARGSLLESFDALFCIQQGS